MVNGMNKTCWDTQGTVAIQAATTRRAEAGRMDLFDKNKNTPKHLKASTLQGRRQQCCPEPREGWISGRGEDGRSSSRGSQRHCQKVDV